MSKKLTTFDRTREALGLPAGEYTEGQQSCFNVVAKKLPRSAEAAKARVVALVLEHKLALKQVEAGMAFLQEHEFAEEDFLKACGVGVTYTDEEIEAFIREFIAQNPQAENFKVLSGTSKRFPWAAADVVRRLVERCTEGRVVEKPQREPKAKKAPIPDGPTLLPLEQVYSIIPAKNRYEQLPGPGEEHEAFLRELGATVLTRFPPEPNGYLHLGHAKSMFINFGYAKLRGGKTYLRLDDTNPGCESTEYVQAIEEMMRWLGHEPFKVTHASDYFDRMYETALDLMRKGLLYVDDQTPDQVAEYREKRLDPPNRDRPPAESLRLFREMTMGLWPEGSLTVRMRINMQDDNPNMRDPVAYRIKYHSHQQCGDRWCVYPAYDFAHCLNDAFEHITHSICTLEFNIRRPSYDWLTHVAGGYRPMQWEFSRLNLTHTVMSKRRLLKLVHGGYVDGWSDPRMPTLVGLRRRGYTASVINTFCQMCGVSRNDQLIDVGLLDYVARQEFERTADRCMAVLEPLRVELADFEAERAVAYPLHPAEPARGTVQLTFGRVLFIERSAFRDGPADAGWASLAPGHPVALRYGPVLYVREVVRRGGRVERLVCTHSWDDAAKQALAAERKRERKTLLHIHWVSEADAAPALVRLYEPLFRSRDPAQLEDWLADLNPASLVERRGALLPRAAAAHAAEPRGRRVLQFERLGFFVVDEGSSAARPVWNRVTALKGGRE